MLLRRAVLHLAMRVACRRKLPKQWAVEDILAHEWTADGFKFFIKWAGVKRNGEAYDNTWEPVSGVGDGLVDDYFARIEQTEKMEVTADISPLVNQARSVVKERLTTGKTKCRPRVHEVPLEGITLKAVAMAFLEIVRGVRATSGCAARRRRATILPSRCRSSTPRTRRMGSSAGRSTSPPWSRLLPSARCTPS